MENCVLEVKNVSKKAKDFQILRNVSFSLKKGEIVGLIGPNGAGKTSIMKILTGLTRKYQGTIAFHDVQNVGCMIETPNFYPYWSGKQNLEYFAKLNGVGKERVEELLKLLGLYEAKEKKVRTYSLGMRQRLGIAQALLTQPNILILDEPTNGLDPEGIYEIREYIRKIARENQITVLISSHLLSELEKLCDRAILIKKGEIVKNIVLMQDAKNNEIDFTIESADPEETKRVLIENQVHIKNSAENRITIVIKRTQKKDIAALLMKNGIVITEMYEDTDTLEDRFLELVN